MDLARIWYRPGMNLAWIWYRPGMDLVWIRPGDRHDIYNTVTSTLSRP